MPTPLSRDVTRKVCSASFGDLVVTLSREGIYFREPRRRTKFLLPYGNAFQRAAFLYAENEKRQRRELAKAKRQARRRG